MGGCPQNPLPYRVLQRTVMASPSLVPQNPKFSHPLSQYLYETPTVHVVKNNKHVMHDLKMKLLEMEAVITGGKGVDG